MGLRSAAGGRSSFLGQNGYVYLVSSIRLIPCAALVACAAAAAPGLAARVSRPEDAVAAVKRIVVRNARACKTDWTRIRALGYTGHWKVTATVRSSRAGSGLAVWWIGTGRPVATDRFARRLAHGCR